MLTTPITTEIVCQITDEEQLLREHFNFLYIILAENQLIPNATFEILSGGLKRCLSGIPVPYHNALFGYPHDIDWDICIQEQLEYFREAKMPFVWYLDEKSSSEFKAKLSSYGFQDGGIFRGVIGMLDKPIPNVEIPDNCVLEQVENENTMDEFNELVCLTFGIHDTSKDLYKKVLWNAAQSPHPRMFHWVARKDGKVVSALSTLIIGDIVSFWNGASLPEMRRQGFSTALRCLALKDAIARGCRTGASYLMSEGMALGICSRLGYQTKWRFNVFIAPAHFPNEE